MAKLPEPTSDDALEAIWTPYILSLGKVAHAWNHLQEELGKLFCSVANVSNSIGLSIWHSSKSDRAQRDMLEAVTAARSKNEEWSKKYPLAFDDIRWLLNRVNKVADQRNDAVHAPCSLGIESGELEIIPIVFFGNPRAIKLCGKDILNEFAWYEKSAQALTSFARQIKSAVDYGAPCPWPDKPEMPILEPAPRHR